MFSAESVCPLKEDGARSNATNLGRSLLQRTPEVWSSHGCVINNVCESVGITFSRSDGLVAGKQVSRSGSGSDIFPQGLPSTQSPTIIGNARSGRGPISPEMKSELKRSPNILTCRIMPDAPCANASHGKETSNGPIYRSLVTATLARSCL